MKASLTKAFLTITFASFAMSCASYGQNAAASIDVQSRKWICVLEKAAGVMYANPGAKEATPGAINFEERHKKFVLTIKPIVRSQYDRDLCRFSLSHWMPILAEKGTFDPSDQPRSTGGDISKFYDYRINIGPDCFASDEATVKFFDRNRASRLVNYDFAPHEFVSGPGEWLELYADNTFHAGARLDLGPVVFTGKCERID
jgi:hypothetical protein